MDSLALGLLAGVLIGGISYRFHLLSISGTCAAVMLAIPVFGYGGLMWATPLLVFFVVSSLLSKIGRARKAQFDLVFEKGDRRDAFQVLANGGVAGVIAVWYAVTGRVELYPLYCTALAVAAADTWATEIGTLAKDSPRLITTLKKMPAGTSGGVTHMGMMGALAGAMSVAFSGWIFEGTLYTVWAVTLCGVLGSVIDSVLGAIVQAQYQCGVCDKVTEKVIHCDQETERISGWAWMNNDWVNFGSGLGGVLFAWYVIGIG